jgi:hypothetical protein
MVVERVNEKMNISMSNPIAVKLRRANRLLMLPRIRNGAIPRRANRIINRTRRREE